jgi:ABC-type transport system substrate-binding protein
LKLLGCLVSTVLLLHGCSGEEPRLRSLSLALETAPNKLDPAFVVDVSEGIVSSLIYQGLVRFTPRGSVEPDAARSWEVADGGTRYVFHLDTRMKFSNGRTVTAADVRYSVERVLSPDGASPRRWVFERILGAQDYSDGSAASVRGLDTPDDSTVVMTLDGPFHPFVMLLGMPSASIVPAEDAERLSDTPVGSGAWKVRQWERGDRIVLVPNEFNPRHSRSLDDIEFRIIPEPFTRIAEFESRTLDILHVPAAELDRFLGDPKQQGHLQRVTELRVTYVGLNNRHPVLKDKRVRRALNMAVDVDRMIQVLLDGQGTRAAGVIPPSLAGYRPRDPIPYDPAGARRLLREAGVAEGFPIEIWQRESPEGDLLCEAIQGYLKQVGIDARLVKREWSAFKEAVSRGKVDAFLLDWYADYPDAENFLYPLFDSRNMGGGGNRAFFRNPAVDSLIELSQRAADEQQTARLYAAADSLVYDEAPWIFLYFPVSVYAIAPEVEGYEASVMYLGEDYTGVRKVAPANRED